MRDVVRGATFDLLAGLPAEQFERLEPEAWSTLEQEDRHALQWRMLRAEAVTASTAAAAAAADVQGGHG